MIDADKLSERFEKRSKIQGGWQVRCPSHDDRSPSLSICDGDKGVVIHCHAGCKTEDICTAMGIEMRDLFPEREKFGDFEIVETYDYRDEKGSMTYQVVRLFPKSFRQRRPDGLGGWIWKLDNVQRIPYRLPQLIDSVGPVFVVEGERDVDRLRSLGLNATCNAGGSGGWVEAWSQWFAGRDVCIIPDNDDAGREHAQDVAIKLGDEPTTVRIVELPGLPPKGDVSDWLEAGNDHAKLLEYAAGAQPSIGFDLAVNRIGLAEGERVNLSEKVTQFDITYLDDICLGVYPNDLIVVSAASGAGKTTLGTMLAQNAAEAGRRVHFFALEAHKGEIEQRILFREVMRIAKDRGIHGTNHTLAHWMYGRAPELDSITAEAIETIKPKIKTLHTFYRTELFTHKKITEAFRAIRKETDLVILDHLHYIDTESNNENGELKKIIKGIRDSSLDLGVPVIVIAHLRKKDRSNPRLIPDVDDIHGASDIAKVATKIVLIAPLREHEHSSNVPTEATTLIQVVKDRLVGFNGYCGLLTYDLQTLSYRKKYIVAKLSDNGSKLAIVNNFSVPSWAKHGVGI